jgi:hypothetical protein
MDESGSESCPVAGEFTLKIATIVFTETLKYLQNSTWLRGSFYKQVIPISLLKMTVFWDVVPCSLVEINQCFRCVYCLHHQGDEWLLMEAVSMSETSVNFIRDCTSQHPKRIFILAAVRT